VEPDVLTVVNTKSTVFWKDISCSLGDRYQHFCPEDGGNIFIWNVGTCLTNCMASLVGRSLSYFIIVILLEFGTYSWLLAVLVIGQGEESSVDIVAGCVLDDWGIKVRFILGVRYFHFFPVTRPAPVPIQPPTQWVLGLFSLEIKLSGREAYHWPPSVMVESGGAIHLLPHTYLFY
jgi:hypothetical protein